jgi:hypothetical protein
MNMHQEQELFRIVINEIQNWIPSQNYDHESKFQNELSDLLDERLNENNASPTGQDRDIPVYRERGIINADISVNDIIGIEMKRNLTNNQAKKLRGQIESYLDHYNFVIIVACGILDTSHWRELKNIYKARESIANGFVEFIWKKRENYETDSEEDQQQNQSSPENVGYDVDIPENPLIGMEAPDVDESVDDPDFYDPFS